MSYLLLAVGALMAAVGLYLAVTGYGIVQAEVGWSSFIAGTTLLAGGIVTMALGIVLRSLTRLLADHGGDRTPTSTNKERPRDEPILPRPASPVDSSGDDKDEKLPSAPEDLRAPVAPLRRLEPKSSDDSYRLESPSTSEHDLVEADTPPEMPPKTTGDWLDQTFAELDRDSRPPMPKRSAPRFGARSDPAAADKSIAPATVREEAWADAEPQNASVAEPVDTLAAPAALGSPSSVIGRYEADGTSYIMYADGSIEAQTHGGVYRFASMAELKAFIES